MIFATIGIFIFTFVLSVMVIDSNEIKAKADNNENINAEEQNSNIKNSSITVNGSNVIKVYRTADNKVEEINIEDYVCGVVANEMPVNFDSEALKAQAVASRTYVTSKLINKCTLNDEADVCDSTHCQVYTSKEERIGKWEDGKGEENWNKIQEAVKATEGKVLTYNGELVLYPQFFSTSSGKTENSQDINWGAIPYLKSVDSPGEEIAPKFTSENNVSINTLVAKINEKYPKSGVNLDNVANNMKIISRSDAGGVKEIKVGNETINGTDFRFLLGLNSTNFSYEIDGDTIIFTCKGYGHGVGMSQWGANVMGKNGSSYDEILKHYYTGVDISTLNFK